MDIKRMLAKGIRIVFNPAALTNRKVNTNAKICSPSKINKRSIE